MSAGAAPSAWAQDQDNRLGPMAPPPTFKVNRIPSVPHPGPPPIPEQQIIQTFAAKEDAAQKAYDTYRFTETLRIEELMDPGGKFTAVGESYVKPDGMRYWRVTNPPQSSLKLTTYTLEDVRTMMSIPLFFLTSDQIAKYNLTYVGQQKLDELNTYIFQVKPKELSRKQKLFDGIVYIDDHDLAIVECFGKFVSEWTGGSGDKLPFSMYEIYRENFQEKYWLPTYISSDDYSGSLDSQLHLRLVIRSTDFKVDTPSSTPVATPAAAPPVAPPH